MDDEIDDELRERIDAAAALVTARMQEIDDGDWYAVGWWFEQGYLAGTKDTTDA